MHNKERDGVLKETSRKHEAMWFRNRDSSQVHANQMLVNWHSPDAGDLLQLTQDEGPLVYLALRTVFVAAPAFGFHLRSLRWLGYISQIRLPTLALTSLPKIRTRIHIATSEIKHQFAKCESAWTLRKKNISTKQPTNVRTARALCTYLLHIHVPALWSLGKLPNSRCSRGSRLLCFVFFRHECIFVCGQAHSCSHLPLDREH